MSNILRTWAELSPSALRHNVAAIRNAAGPGKDLMGVVKANAYGHGLKEIAPLLANQVDRFGVANLNEAIALAEAAPGVPIFLLSAALPTERVEVLRRGITPWISSAEEAIGYQQAAQDLGQPVSVHLKFDTGMGRLGVLVEEAESLLKAIAGMPFLHVSGIATHMPVADDDTVYTREQCDRFFELLRNLGLTAPLVHIQNSAGVLQRYPAEGANMVRVGLALYGIAPNPEFQELLRPVLTWKTRVTLCREIPAGHSISYGRTYITTAKTPVAALAVGYADGYQRQLSNRGAYVLIRGKRCPVLGRVTMDQTLVDLSPVGLVPPGEEVVLIGTQGEETILASDLARMAGTIAWEIFTGIGQRVARIVV